MDALDVAAVRLPWASGVVSDFLLPNEIETGDDLAREFANGFDAETIRVLIDAHVRLLYPVRSRRTYEARRCALDAMQEQVGLALPVARQARQAAELAVRKAAAGAAMRRLPARQILAAATEADEFGLWSERIEAIVAEECAWWARRRAVAE